MTEENGKGAAPQPKPKKETTTLGIPEDVAGALCYIYPWVSGVVMLLLERKSTSVRFHALQSIMVALPFMIMRSVAQPLFGAFGEVVDGLFKGLMILTFVLLAGATLMGKKLKVPKIGDFCERHLDILK